MKFLLDRAFNSYFVECLNYIRPLSYFSHIFSRINYFFHILFFCMLQGSPSSFVNSCFVKSLEFLRSINLQVAIESNISHLCLLFIITQGKCIHVRETSGVP